MTIIKQKKRPPPSKNARKPKGRKNLRPILKLPKIAEAEITIQLNKTFDVKDGVKSPTMREAVEDLLARLPVSRIHSEMENRYGVSPSAVNRAIAYAKDAYAAELAASKPERIARGVRFLDQIASKAFETENFGHARSAVMDRHRLAGDFKDKLDLGLNRSGKDLLDEADELRREADEALKLLKRGE